MVAGLLCVVHALTSIVDRIHVCTCTLDIHNKLSGKLHDGNLQLQPPQDHLFSHTLLTGNTQHAHQPFTPAPMASLPLEDDVRIITAGNQAKLPAEAE